MKRNQSDGISKKDNTDHLEEKRCPKCGNNKMWKPRGQENPQYRNKCTKCQHIIRFK